MSSTSSIELRLRVMRAAVVVALATCAAAAQAVIYISNFDPLGFSGVATFYVDPACLLADGAHNNDGVTCSVDWLDASVTLDDQPGPDTFDFNLSAFLPSAVAVLSIDVSGGEVSGVHSAPVGPVLIAGNPVPEFNGLFSLQFAGTGVSLLNDGQLAATATAQFARVPEPATAGLLLLALAMPAATARRRAARLQRLHRHPFGRLAAALRRRLRHQARLARG